MRSKRRTAETVILVVFALLFLGACSSAQKKGVFPPAGNVAGRVPSDTALFEEGLTRLGAPGKPADYDKAGEVFRQLLQSYPQSKWRSYALAYSKLLEELKAKSAETAAMRVETEEMQTENEELRQSLEQTKKANRSLQEKLNTEIARLMQENEQLRNDIERLKQLEINLQRRDRSFR